ncbi:hypothetical protein MOO44_05720 [Nicoliella spurrieriana]|uniref:Uncharacterized protein n=1 Tax=Nicoliella spurrieriana TaxID=2925830 RepID=A0A976X554_9LACO|nr:hypothetical protein [Nicoliella spurrieriana]UQS86414.1 hypothetical protein MOO44_05720 [Nicoliella spurrieriana]
MIKNYRELLEQLKNGQIDKIEVDPKSFMDFQAAFMDFESRKRVVGVASRDGNVVYHFESH